MQGILDLLGRYRNEDNFNRFKTLVKTFLFNIAYNI